MINEKYWNSIPEQKINLDLNWIDNCVAEANSKYDNMLMKYAFIYFSIIKNYYNEESFNELKKDMQNNELTLNDGIIIGRNMITDNSYELLGLAINYYNIKKE